MKLPTSFPAWSLNDPTNQTANTVSSFFQAAPWRLCVRLFRADSTLSFGGWKMVSSAHGAVRDF
jgi:hypothetical protein